MVLNSPITKQSYIFLLQTKKSQLLTQLSDAVAGEDITIVSVENSEEIGEQQIKGKIITFIIGSDVEDPVQSAQRLHALENHAKIILLSSSEKNTRNLKEAIRFSPFLGNEVFCLNETNEPDLERLSKILRNSVQAEKNRAIISSTNSQISHSISSRKQVYNQQFINKIMEVAPIGIVIVSRRGKILGWNKEAASIFNKTESQVLGNSLSRLFDPLEGQKLEDYIKNSFQITARNSPIDLVIEREAQDASKQILNLTAAPFTHPDVYEKSLILAIKDVTEREMAKQQLSAINETLEERVEERTAALLSYQEQLRSLGSQLSKAEEKERQRLAAELHDHLGQMLALLKLKVSQIQTQPLTDGVATGIRDLKAGVEEALVYTRDLMSDLKPPPSLDKEEIKHTIKWLAQKMEKHNLHVTINDDDQPKPVSDEIRIIIVQCLRELLFNIVKHARVQEAAITLFRLEKEAKIIVEDKGVGFNPDIDRSHLPDNGFGLFNVSERIDLLGGSLDIESKEGMGTKVTICVPLLEKVEQKPQSEIANKDLNNPVSSAINLAKVKVLLADDHKMMREGLKKIINDEMDMTVIAEAENGEEVLRIAEEMRPDIVVMDVNMPVMDGIEATRRLLEKMPMVRVIGLSFHAHQNVVESMKKAGATAYLTKKEAFETLCATIRSEAKLAG